MASLAEAKKSRSELLVSGDYDTTAGENVNREIKEPRYLPTAEEMENGQASYGRSFDEMVDGLYRSPAAFPYSPYGTPYTDALNAMVRAHAARTQIKRANVYQPKGFTDTNAGDIINKEMISTKITERGEVVNPMDKEEYLTMVDALKWQGIKVTPVTGDDDLRYMLLLGAEGTYANGEIRHIGAIPSRGTLIEEIIHSAQARMYGEPNSYDMIEVCAREIEANRKLLKYQKEYRLDALDVSDIERNLPKWEAAFKFRTGVSYDESNYRGGV